MPNLQSIYLLKMYRNPFTHFLIAGEAHAKCRCCAILAILPFVTLLIAEDEAQSAEFAIYLFAEDVPQSIHSLFDCQVRHEVPMLCHSCNPAFRDPFDCRG